MKPIIAAIHPYWDFWESSVPKDLLIDRKHLLAEAAELLAQEFEVLLSAMASNPLEAAEMVEFCVNVDVIVIICSMAVPPATAMALLEALPQVPVVIWAVGAAETVPNSFSHSDITTTGATVGAPMLGSALARLSRPFDLVISTLATPENIGSAVRRAAAAGAIRHARVLRIGEKIPGFTTVDAPSNALAAFGPTVVDVDPTELVRRVGDVQLDRVEEIMRQIESEFQGIENIDHVALLRAVRTEAVLRDFLVEKNAVAGALNCHVAALRPHSDYGIAPCLALGRLTSDGIPWTCTGDVLTSIAMLAVQSLGHPTLYHEVEALDHIENEAILANSGEHDLRLSGGLRPDLVPNVWFEHDLLTAPCARFSIPAGPASLVGFVYAPEPRFVVAEGIFTGRDSPATGVSNAGFRFSSGPVREAWARWGQAGVLHHSVATNAHLADDIEVVARHLGAAFWRI